MLILSGDHIYKMNYGRMLRQHNDSGADMTLATIQIDPDETSRFGVVDVDKDGRVNGFRGKAEDRRSCVRPTIPKRLRHRWGSICLTPTC